MGGSLNPSLGHKTPLSSVQIVEDAINLQKTGKYDELWHLTLMESGVSDMHYGCLGKIITKIVIYIIFISRRNIVVMYSNMEKY